MPPSWTAETIAVTRGLSELQTCSDRVGRSHCALDEPHASAARSVMATPTEQNFQDYKRAERKALEIVAAMKAESAKKVDIELALVVAIFELHKGTLPAETIGAIVQGHLKQLLPHYATKPAT